jgi:hypothetical protein
MSDVTTSKFSCDGCGKQYTWKPELAGKKAKCKCGAVMMVPAEPPVAPEADGLYDLAPEETPKPKAKPKVPLAPLGPKGAGASRTESLRPAIATAAVGAGVGGRGGPIPAGVGYQSGPSARERDRFSKDTLTDKYRDIYVPVGMLIAGFLLYLVGYSMLYHVPTSSWPMISVGVGITTAIKAVLLIGFALVVAGPLGVSFGDPFSAALKLAALAVFCDGALQWVDLGVVKLAGQGGKLYGSIFNLFIAAGIYWIMLIYLFSMDSEDSWVVVCLMAAFDNVVRWGIILLLLSSVMSWGGGGGPGGLAGGGGGSGSSAVRAADAEMAEHLDDLRTANALPEAREYIAGGRQDVLKDHVNAFYDAGARNVWFECERDINAKLTPQDMVVELPSDKTKRTAILQKIGDYYKAFGMSDGTPPKDNGQKYVQVPIP